MDFSNAQVILIAYIASNVVAILMLLASWKKPAIARILYLLLFLWASWANTTTALFAPQLYLEYAQFTFLPLYRDFINGLFSHHVTTLVLGIAVCQFLIGSSMLLKGVIFRLGTMGGIVFLLSIAPLGVGSAFPATLVMAAGLYLLIRKNSNIYLWQALFGMKKLKMKEMKV
ncbi:MAG: hypothetical protein ACK4TA_15880 [Saprospiraceae bacterium]